MLATPTTLPFRSAGVLYSGLARNCHGVTGTNSATARRSAPPVNALIASVPPKFPTCTFPERSAADEALPPLMSVRSTSRLYFAKRPSSFAMKGARFDGVTLPYEDTIFVGGGLGVVVAAAADPAADGAALGDVVAPPHAVAMTAAVRKKTRSDRIADLPRSRSPRDARMVIPFAVSFEQSRERRLLLWLCALKIAAIAVVFDPAALNAFQLPKSLASRALEWPIAAVVLFAL